MDSVLNPEAPEFYPPLTSVTRGGYATVSKSIKSSNHLPSGASYQIFQTFTDFNIITSQLSENVVLQSNQILTTELPTVKLKHNDDEYNIEKIIDANDNMLDRVNVNIDTVNGLNKPSDMLLKKTTNSISNNSLVIAKIQVGSTMFIGGKNIPRPQLTFKDTIDNSESLWVPKIVDKPNNIKPLALSILYNDNGEAVGYEHPYKVELELYHPPSKYIEQEAEPLFPPPLDQTPLTYVSTERQLDALVEHLNSVEEMAVDLEHHSYRTYQGITCLIQITTDEGGDFIVDALAVREHVHKLNEPFTNPKKIKVLHGADMDVLWLQRDFGVYIVGLFDTHQAARALTAPGLSLKHLLMRYCQVDADKRYQLADWRMRPLPAELVQYARMDTHYLLYIWRRMRGELLAAAAGQTHLLLAVFEQSRQICGTTYHKEMVDENSHMAVYIKSKKSFNSQQMAALKMLFKWRDSQARELDESTTYLLPNHMLLALAETLPREVQGVNACCSPMPPFVKQNLMTIHRMLLSCRELPVEPQLYRMPPSISSMAHSTQHPALVYKVHDLAHYQEFRDEQPVDLVRAVFSTELYTYPEISAFAPTYDNREIYNGFVSNLNVDAKQFIPPYDRYRKYRSLAQLEEIKEYKNKEAKIAAIGKGNELIKAEVLIKLQQAKCKLEEGDVEAEAKPVKLGEDKKASHKRKMSTEKSESKDGVNKITKPNKRNSANNIKKNTVKSFLYSEVNYKKFYDDTKKLTRKQRKCN